MDDDLLSDIGEFGLIERIAALTGKGSAIVGIGDDAAVLEGPEDRYLLATVDMLVQNRHFRLDRIEPEEIGATALAVNISDIAAMGGEPRYALASLAVKPGLHSRQVERIFAGLTGTAREYGVTLVGGNVTSIDGPLALDVVLLGEVRRDEVVLRRGAIWGDVLAVTGALGGRAATRLALEAGLSIPYRLNPPVPRVSAGRALAAERVVHAMMDISDGLAGDLHHLCRASGVGAVIHEASLPIGAAAGELAGSLQTTPVALALGGGEDYELLMALPPASLERARDAVGDVGLTAIGRVVPASEGIALAGVDGLTRPLIESGWKHF